jgi:phosphosulfolactate phosphohydrolase-like enzyme
VCAGTRENMADEDVLAAGAMGEMLLRNSGRRTISDSVETARNAWRKAKSNLLEVVSEAENARRLLAIPELRDDVAFCLRQDVFPLAAVLGRDGVIRISI